MQRQPLSVLGPVSLVRSVLWWLEFPFSISFGDSGTRFWFAARSDTTHAPFQFGVFASSSGLCGTPSPILAFDTLCMSVGRVVVDHWHLWARRKERKFISTVETDQPKPPEHPAPDQKNINLCLHSIRWEPAKNQSKLANDKSQKATAARTIYGHRSPHNRSRPN